GEPGSDITFFEFPGAAPGRAGDGMIHRVVWRVGSAAALDFWSERLGERDVEVSGVEERDALRFRDHEGLEHELTVSEAPHHGGSAPRGRGPGAPPGPVARQSPRDSRRAGASGIRRRPRLRLRARSL